MQAISNILLNQKDEHFIDKQVDKLSRFFPTDGDLPIMDIVITGTDNEPCVDATIFLDDATLTSHHQDSTARRAIQAAFYDLTGQIRRWQTDKLHHQTLRQNIQSRWAAIL